jgi:hypothetical protein
LRHTLNNIITLLLVTSTVLFLAACSTVSPTSTPTNTPSSSPTATSTNTPAPTLTPTTQPPFAVLLAAPGADPAQVDALQAALNDTITGAGLQWQVRQELTVEELVPELRLVVVVPPDPGLEELVNAAPQTQFIAYNIPAQDPAPNLTIIGGEGDRPDQAGFVAGEIAAMISADWRVGVISLSDTIGGLAARNGFLNGTVYLCGLCRPVHPPFYQYPMYFELPSTATSVEWQEAANYMVDHAVETVYVFPGAGDEAMLSILADAKVNIIGGNEPPQAVKSSWVVSITSDPTAFIEEQVAGILDGSLSGGRDLAVPIQFTNIDPSIFTPGKQGYAAQTASDLQAGFIDTGVDTTTGEYYP